MEIRKKREENLITIRKKKYDQIFFEKRLKTMEILQSKD
jgi:hypothetical protein